MLMYRTDVKHCCVCAMVDVVGYPSSMLEPVHGVVMYNSRGESLGPPTYYRCKESIVTGAVEEMARWASVTMKVQRGST